MALSLKVCLVAAAVGNSSQALAEEPSAKAGEARRLPMSEVSYAGPAASDPGAPPIAGAAPAQASPDHAASEQSRDKRYAQVEGPVAHLHLSSDPPGLVFHPQDATAIGASSRIAWGLARLCAAPCDITVPSGTETFAIGSDEARPYKVQSLTFPAGNSEIHGHYKNNQGKRNLGWGLMAGGLLGGVGHLAAGAARFEQHKADLALGLRGSF